MKKARDYDLIIVGGGPAGSTLAALVKKYDPKRRVLLLEKHPGPRHHVGESLQPGVIPILKELGVFDKVVAAGFPRKVGAVYVWGKDRKPWENVFTDANDQAVFDRDGAIKDSVGSSFQVRRSIYDDILLRHAEGLGAEVKRGVHAQSIIEEDGRIAGVVVRDARGRTVRYRGEFLADCSGQTGFLSKYRRIREYNQSLKNVAAYAYFRGAKWKYRYSGHPDKTKIFICSTPCGWFWYIPIHKDVVSVGFVTTLDYIKKNKADLRALYFEQLEKCGEIWPLLRGAVREKDFDGSGQDFFTQSDWSYMNVKASGPGWFACGDAAVFVDPILSSGVTLAQLGAHRAAYTLLTQWKAPASGEREKLWRDYGEFCREFAAQFLGLALFWYGNDRSAEKWWAQAREMLTARLPVRLSDRTAFLTVSTGLSQYYDRLLSANVLAEVGTRLRDETFYVSVMKGDQEKKFLPASSAARIRPRLTYRFTSEESYFPAYGRGELRPVTRISFMKHDRKDALRDSLNPKRIVSPYHLELLKAIDGKRTLRAALAQAASRGVPIPWLAQAGMAFIRELAIQGVLETGKKISRALSLPTRAKDPRRPCSSAPRDRCA